MCIRGREQGSRIGDAKGVALELRGFALSRVPIQIVHGAHKVSFVIVLIQIIIIIIISSLRVPIQIVHGVHEVGFVWVHRDEDSSQRRDDDPPEKARQDHHRQADRL